MGRQSISGLPKGLNPRVPIYTHCLVERGTMGMREKVPAQEHSSMFPGQGSNPDRSTGSERTNHEANTTIPGY